MAFGDAVREYHLGMRITTQKPYTEPPTFYMIDVHFLKISFRWNSATAPVAYRNRSIVGTPLMSWSLLSIIPTPCIPCVQS